MYWCSIGLQHAGSDRRLLGNRKLPSSSNVHCSGDGAAVACVLLASNSREPLGDMGPPSSLGLPAREYRTAAISMHNSAHLLNSHCFRDMRQGRKSTGVTMMIIIKATLVTPQVIPQVRLRCCSAALLLQRQRPCQVSSKAC